MIATQEQEIEILKAVNNTSSPYPGCTSCGMCCNGFFHITEIEAEVIKNHIRNREIKPIIYNKPLCLFLSNEPIDKDGKPQEARCMIYEARPFVCRFFRCGVVPMELTPAGGMYESLNPVPCGELLWDIIKARDIPFFKTESIGFDWGAFYTPEGPGIAIKKSARAFCSSIGYNITDETKKLLSEGDKNENKKFAHIDGLGDAYSRCESAG